MGKGIAGSYDSSFLKGILERLKLLLYIEKVSIPANSTALLHILNNTCCILFSSDDITLTTEVLACCK